MTGPPIKPKPDKSLEAQALRSSLRYVQDVRDQLVIKNESGDTNPVRQRKLENDLENAQQSAYEVATRYRKARTRKEK